MSLKGSVQDLGRVGIQLPSKKHSLLEPLTDSGSDRNQLNRMQFWLGIFEARIIIAQIGFEILGMATAASLRGIFRS